MLLDRLLDLTIILAGLLATGIEAAYVPNDEGGGEYFVKVEPDLLGTDRGQAPYHFTSDVPADARDVRRVRIYVGDNWPPAVERAVVEAASRPRRLTTAATTARLAEVDGSAVTTGDRPWGWLIGSLIALFLSLGANAYLGMLLQTMRQRYLRDIQEGFVKV
jgi:hypothetical protein